ncbi:hypothetical protein [Pseudalkalibacillus decolorationis]|uniref:hypothetical protein n=1 Tax=Pseudalkalibacillus decolorationis TaxID=163879 RepID=UPI0021491F27|nr:hypothetical protein [Pseudalkalibacillus decolorationis]
MKNKHVWLHTSLLICFALPWINIPFFITNISVSGYMLPFKTSTLAQQLTELGVVAVPFQQMLPLYLILIAPLLSTFLLIQALFKKRQDVRLDCITGFIAVIGSLYIMSNTYDLISAGVFITIPVSLLLAASPLFQKEKAANYAPLNKSA